MKPDPRSLLRVATRGSLTGAGGLWLLLLATGCPNNTLHGGFTGQKDLATGGGFEFGDGGAGGDDGGNTGPNPCGDTDPACQKTGLGPGVGAPFPLGTDPMKDPNETDTGVGRDVMGFIGLDQTHASFDYLWIANSSDWNRGTVSKIDSKAVKEVARYFTVTCNSLPTGSQAGCDGTNGCCYADDITRYNNRKAKQPAGPHSQVDQMDLSPSRTAVDYNGDMFVSNRAFGGQSSVTKIANDKAHCIDRNKNGRIDTSNDANGNGRIETDCNGDGQPDSLGTTCTNGGKLEFFGLDDECVLFTTATNSPQQYGRPLALGQGAMDFGPSDVWAGTYNDGKFFRIDGTTGQYKADAQGPVNAYGATVDAKNILWVAVLNDGQLGYIDTTNPSQSARVRKPNNFGVNAYGIAMDRDQNVWQGGWTDGNAYRYTPDRTNGWKSLGSGYWTSVRSPGANSGANGNSRGIAADSRSPNAYFVWTAKDDGYISRIDASAIPAPKGQDVQVDGSAYPAFRVAGSQTIGAGVDAAQNIWGISYDGSVATRALVDKNGNITTPDIQSAPIGQKACPAGDRCELKDNGSSDPMPYTYSDFTGFGLRNFTNPRGTYSYVVPGCQGQSPDTQWYSVTWDADVPPNTSLVVHARTGKTAVPDASWGAYTTDFVTSPADLRAGMPLLPFDKDNYYLEVDFVLSTQDKNATPKLKSFTVAFKCGNIG